MSEFVRSCSVHSHECDREGRMTLVALLYGLQDIAEEHAGLLDFGYHACKENGCAWVELGLAAKINRLPVFREAFDLKTWTFPVPGVLAERDFELIDSCGEVLAYASTQWVVIDLNKRRPIPSKRVFSNPDVLPTGDKIPALPEAMKRIKLPEDMLFVQSFAVARHCVDLNRHTNNAAYMIWAYDTLPSDWLLCHEPIGMRMSFMKETREGDPVELFLNCDEVSGKTYHLIRSGDKDCVAIVIEWKPVEV